MLNHVTKGDPSAYYDLDKNISNEKSRIKFLQMSATSGYVYEMNAARSHSWVLILRIYSLRFICEKKYVLPVRNLHSLSLRLNIVFVISYILYALITGKQTQIHPHIYS